MFMTKSQKRVLREKILRKWVKLLMDEPGSIKNKECGWEH